MTAKVQRLCPDCGGKNARDASFCQHCGFSFIEGKPAPPLHAPPRKTWLAWLGFETVHKSHWPGLYSDIPGKGRFVPRALLKLFYRPEEAMRLLYPSARASIAIPLLVLTGTLAWSIEAIESKTNLVDGLAILLGGLFSYVLFFIILAAFASLITRFLYGGRGDFRTTLSLLAFSSILLMVLGAIGYGVSGVLPKESLLSMAVVLGILFVGGLWLWAVYSSAVSAANDVLPAAGTVIVLPGALVASYLIDGISALVQPTGLSVASTLIPFGFL